MTLASETLAEQTAKPSRTTSAQRPLADQVRENPLLALAVAAMVGFVTGGGARSRAGLAMLMFVGKLATRKAVLSAIVKAVDNHGSGRRAGPN
jgi:hypothetical protein